MAPKQQKQASNVRSKQASRQQSYVVPVNALNPAPPKKQPRSQPASQPTTGKSKTVTKEQSSVETLAEPNTGPASLTPFAVVYVVALFFTTFLLLLLLTVTGSRTPSNASSESSELRPAAIVEGTTISSAASADATTTASSPRAFGVQRKEAPHMNTTPEEPQVGVDTEDDAVDVHAEAV
ncbi:hypothetical protein MTO96_020757 [Rhipicephalus appendiculatus]